MNKSPMYKSMADRFLIMLPVLLLFFAAAPAKSQTCSSAPTFVVDLTGQPLGAYTSTAVLRAGTCCSSSNCVAFLVTLDPRSTGVLLNISSGAIPSGSLSYQSNCGGASTVGSAICISGVGPHLITFCKPGGNVNTYTISSTSAYASPDFSMLQTQTRPMTIKGVDAASVVWTSIYPGNQGDYNSYLNCTSGCDSVTITAPLSAPAEIHYQVRGNIKGGCFTTQYVDTIKVFISANPLPVQLTSFDGYQENNTVMLEWTTMSEINNQYFELEHSMDGFSFKSVATIDGYGNSNVAQAYSYAHTTAEQGINYYRLKQVDTDHTTTYLKMIAISYNQSTNTKLSCYPNPFMNKLTISYNSTSGNAELPVMITGMNGDLFSETKLAVEKGVNQVEINTENWPQGIYILHLDNSVQKIIKQ